MIHCSDTLTVDGSERNPVRKPPGMVDKLNPINNGIIMDVVKTL